MEFILITSFLANTNAAFIIASSVVVCVLTVVFSGLLYLLLNSDIDVYTEPAAEAG